jgi:hypothetical protein
MGCRCSVKLYLLIFRAKVPDKQLPANYYLFALSLNSESNKGILINTESPLPVTSVTLKCSVLFIMASCCLPPVLVNLKIKRDLVGLPQLLRRRAIYLF